MSEKTIFDLQCVPCWCDHEKIGRMKFVMTSDVINAVKTCAFAMNGLMIGCAHRGETFFKYNGQKILASAMKEKWIESKHLDNLYAIKWYLDVLKRRACGRCFPMDATVAQMRQSDAFVPLLQEKHPVRDMLLRIFAYAENFPKDPEEIRICDLCFLNVDKYLSDSIKLILQSVQGQTQKAA